MSKNSELYKQYEFNKLYKQLQRQSKQNQKLMKKFRKLRNFEKQGKKSKDDKKENIHQNTIDYMNTDKQYLSKITHLLVFFSTGLNSKPMLKELHRCIEELLIHREYYLCTHYQEINSFTCEYSMFNIWNYVIKLCNHTQLLEPKYISKRLPNLFKMLQKYESPYSSSGTNIEITYNFLNHTNRHISNGLQQYILDREHNVPAEVIAWKTKQLYIYMVSKLYHANVEISSMLDDSVKYIHKHPNQHFSINHTDSINKIYKIFKKYEESYMKQFTYYNLIHRAEETCDSKRDVERLDKKLRNRLNKRLLDTKLYEEKLTY